MLSQEQTAWYSANEDQCSVKAPESMTMMPSLGGRRGTDRELYHAVGWIRLKWNWAGVECAIGPATDTSSTLYFWLYILFTYPLPLLFSLALTILLNKRSKGGGSDDKPVLLPSVSPPSLSPALQGCLCISAWQVFSPTTQNVYYKGRCRLMENNGEEGENKYALASCWDLIMGFPSVRHARSKDTQHWLRQQVHSLNETHCKQSITSWDHVDLRVILLVYLVIEHAAV